MQVLFKRTDIFVKAGGFLLLMYIGMQIKLQREVYVSSVEKHNVQRNVNNHGPLKENTSVSNSKEIAPQVDLQVYLEPQKGIQIISGKRRAKKGTFTIGIPSANRPNAGKVYLYDTVDSLINNTSVADKEETVLVIMLCDTNTEHNNNVADALVEKYEQDLNSGFLIVIQTKPTMYPNLTAVKETFNDSRDRLKWRAKQNLDFAFLMSFSQNLSDFYVQLEDDVIAAAGFIEEMKLCIKEAQQEWFVLEFSRLGFIGKLFRSSDLPTVASYLIKYFDEAPGDLMLGSIRMANRQPHPLHSNVSLFQHVGRFSSLKNKFMPSIDRSFKDIANASFETDYIPFGDNPEAFVSTSLDVYDKYEPIFVYDNNMTTFFWALNAKQNDVIVNIEFKAAQNITRIVVVSGDSVTRKDFIQGGNLYYSRSESSVPANEGEKRSCGSSFSKLLMLIEGDADTMATGTVIPPNVKCLRIVSSMHHKTWIIIREIRVYTK